MTKIKKPRFKLWLLMIAVAVFWTFFSGFNRNLSAASEETYRGLKLFSDVIDLIEKNYVDPVDSKELIQKAIQGMVQGLDPHSSLLPPEALEELQMETQGEFGGIGIVITQEDEVFKVISPIEGTPAYKAGIVAGDRIINVDGQSTKGMMLWEAVKKMRGPKGTEVVLTIERDEAPEPLEFKLIRDLIPIESIRHFTLKPGYGYIWITNFRENTTEDLEKILKVLETASEPLKGLVLDLRDNPGGLLNQAISVSDLFLNEGIIVSIKGRLNRHTQTFQANPDTQMRTYPIVALINGGSASAAEIVAGALQDHKRALILGTASFGKGSVQTVENLRDGYGLKFTIARYYPPSGRSIQAQGIEPDVIVRQKFAEEKGAAEKPEHGMKEKDLKNHLEPESKPDSKVHPIKKPGEQTAYPEGLNLETLKSDQQVQRALEILTSYEIFAGSKKTPATGN
ncbi:MAG: S41 family peptidase [Desulfobacterales bacterium]|nr:S41 family peptidase [Desulfobacterales bacterium]